MKYVIIGAGIAGLSAAYKLLEKKHEVTVLEKQSEIGGLAKSFHYGDFIFDIGPHRFFTDKDDVYQFIRFVLKEDSIVIPRKSSIYLLNRYFSWPFNPSIFVKLPLGLSLKVGFDMFLKSKFKDQDFQNEIMNRYGKTLYNLFFKEYMEKFCHISCEKMDRSWAGASLDKAIIDKRRHIGSLFDLLKTTLKSTVLETRFLYPKGGCGNFAQSLGKMINDRKGRIIKNIEDISFNFKDGELTSLRYKGPNNEEEIAFDHLIYTAPLTQLAQKLNLPIPNLEYLHSIIYNIEINKPLKNPNQWIYFGDEDLIFSRASFPRNFDEDNVPAKKDSLCVEITCKNNSFLWKIPTSIKDRVIDDLIKVKLCQRKDISNIHIEKISHTYPIYKLNYLDELENTKRQLSDFHNLTCLGRTGTFWYNNMDESIKMALQTTDYIG